MAALREPDHKPEGATKGQVFSARGPRGTGILPVWRRETPPGRAGARPSLLSARYHMF